MAAENAERVAKLQKKLKKAQEADVVDEALVKKLNKKIKKMTSPSDGAATSDGSDAPKKRTAEQDEAQDEGACTILWWLLPRWQCTMLAGTPPPHAVHPGCPEYVQHAAAAEEFSYNRLWLHVGVCKGCTCARPRSSGGLLTRLCGCVLAEAEAPSKKKAKKEKKQAAAASTGGIDLNALAQVSPLFVWQFGTGEASLCLAVCLAVWHR